MQKLKLFLNENDEKFLYVEIFFQINNFLHSKFSVWIQIAYHKLNFND